MLKIVIWHIFWSRIEFSDKKLPLGSVTLLAMRQACSRMSNSWKPPPSLNRGGTRTWVLCPDKWSNNIRSQGCIRKNVTFFRNLDNKATAQRKYVLKPSQNKKGCKFFLAAPKMFVFFKVHIFWEGQKILINLHFTLEWHYIGQK